VGTPFTVMEGVLWGRETLAWAGEGGELCVGWAKGQELRVEGGGLEWKLSSGRGGEGAAHLLLPF
jgi:hypothetical protein